MSMVAVVQRLSQASVTPEVATVRYNEVYEKFQPFGSPYKGTSLALLMIVRVKNGGPVPVHLDSRHGEGVQKIKYTQFRTDTIR